jgi:glucose uptake protein GlcU
MTKTKKMMMGVVAIVVMALPMVLVSVANAQFNVDERQAINLGVSRNNSSNLVSTIFTVIKGLLSVVFVVAVLMFVIAGLFFLTSAGSDRADQARDMVTYAIIGLVVSVLGYAIVVFLSKALKGQDTGGL